MTVDTITLGDVEITRVVELSGKLAPAGVLIPDSGSQVWRDNESWLVTDFWDPADDTVLCNVQTWVVRSEGRTVLVDTGIGNDRDRPQNPRVSGMQTDFLDRLGRIGVRPEDVDVVVNTHIHFDHVGWNTRLDDGVWVPTFPNATYLMPRLDYEYFKPEGCLMPKPSNDFARLRWEGNKLVFKDSIFPVEQAGQARLWEGTHRIDANLTLEQAPGHSPGSSVLTLRSGTDKAVFVGDIVHSPVQVLRPDCNSCFCEDRDQAARTRRKFLHRAADGAELVIPAHFPGHGAAEVRRDGEQFAISGWADFSDN